MLGSGGCVASTGMEELTSLVVQLFQHLADDLTDALQRLDILFCLIKILLQTLDL